MAGTAGISPMNEVAMGLCSGPDLPRAKAIEARMDQSTPPAQSGGHEQRLDAGGGLEAPQDDVDVQGIDLHAPAGPARLLGGHEGRSGTEEGIQHDVIAMGQVE